MSADRSCRVAMRTRQRKDGRWSAVIVIHGPEGREASIAHGPCATREMAEGFAKRDANELIDLFGWIAETEPTNG